MSKIKIFTVVGARPQFVKAAVLSRVFAKTPQIEETLVHTGQHHDHNMSDVFFDEMEIPRPAFNLGIHGKSHGAMTGQMLEGLEEIFIRHTPDLVLVYGDTNSTLAGALAAVKLHLQVAHVEAGLRSFNMQMPEEVNRILTDRISNYLFCPTQTAVENLRKEGYPCGKMKILLSGDVMQDAALFYAEKSASHSKIASEIPAGEYILCTLHRAENTDHPERLKAIFDALKEISKDRPVILPLHPRTRKIIAEAGINTPVKILNPVGYFDMLELIRHSSLIMTDSGGLQKEAFFFQKHCVTLRNETEWVELVNGGYNELAGADTNRIIESVRRMMMKESNFSVDLYGGGHAADRIVNELLA